MKPDPQRVIDPVCRMTLDAQSVKASVVHNGQTYHFCSVGCRAEFERHPDDYADSKPPESDGDV